MRQINHHTLTTRHYAQRQAPPIKILVWEQDETPAPRKQGIQGAVAKKHSGFTTLEVIISILIFTLAILLVNSIYILSLRSYNKGSNEAELMQNMRVSLDRITRELRQSANIATDLPETNDDPLNPPAEEIIFQDGHDVSRITYLKYYLNGSDLKRRHYAYYFTNESDNYVYYDSVDEYGNHPEIKEIEDRIIGEHFNDMQFWGANGLINISLILNKNQKNIQINTSVFSRNF